ncbi:MAG: glycogen debranching protein GlgX [Candidatus Ancillula sp.]|jgi:glycogen operon protein|nr:glycogen debranching protein GlgX [Candidatus Ancillula sp.]
MQYIVSSGSPFPLGATYDGSGVNFAVFSEVAEKVELCIIDGDNKEHRINVIEKDNHVWHIRISGIGEGVRYGFRVYGPNDEQNGNRCNPSKLLIDPYAKAIEGMIDGDESLYSYYFDQDKAGEVNTLDSKDHTMHSVVVSPYFDWGNDRSPKHSYSDTIIYELHVKGMTELFKKVPESLRGTYLGLAYPSVIKYLKDLGITAVELMPVHQFVNDPSLVEKGLNNYWGYNTIGYFAPHNKYSATGEKGEQVREFKEMVRTFHENDIEVILDVVYNHTAEGNHMGPTLSFKGIDNRSYYRLVENDKKHYFDTTGTGNSLLMRSPQTLQLITDSLRYWVTDMHVDGFRFDLAATLARQFHEVDRLSAFFDVVHQDPIISQVKLIAEPWDLGDGGYQVGGFPVLWSEWNGRYRDVVRDFWRSQDSTLAEFATRITGSSDLYARTGRKPVASVNFITAHDGFTLNDLVSYNNKHNEANGEDNRDGESNNRSWNCGAEGITDDDAVLTLRQRQRRNFLSTLFLSQGIPMLAHGDEVMRTQQGNNNTYCQDNEITWMDWDFSGKNGSEKEELYRFTSKLIHFRLKHPSLHRRDFFQGNGDVAWFDNTGSVMDSEDWSNFFAKTMMVYLNGKKITERDKYGNEIVDDSFIIIFNAHFEPMEFVLPKAADNSKKIEEKWRVVIDTKYTDGFVGERRGPVKTGSKIKLESRSLVLLESISR